MTGEFRGPGGGGVAEFGVAVWRSSGWRVWVEWRVRVVWRTGIAGFGDVGGSVGGGA